MSKRFAIETVFKGIDNVSAPISKMQNSVGRFTRNAEVRFRSATGAVNKFAGTLQSAGKTVFKYGSVAIAGLTGALVALVQQYSKIEDAEAAFTPLLGGAEKAKQLVEMLNATAASTPFQFETLAGTANQLLPVMNGNLEETIRITRMLGDTAGGNAQKLDSITRGYTKAMLKQKVDMESLNMIAEAGVPIYEDLAAVMGTTVGESFFKMISAGKIASSDLTKAFQRMTGEGGKFFNGMDIASKTTSGIWSTLKDNIGLTAAEIGGVLAPTIKELLTAAIGYTQIAREWIKQNKTLIDSEFQKFLITIKDTFVFLKENGATILKVVGAFIALVAVMNTLATVLTLINLIMMANPITLMALGAIAAVAAFAGLLTYIVSIADKFNWISNSVEKIASAGRSIGNFFGGGESDADFVQGLATSPQERVARSIEERRETSNAEVTIKDDTGKAEVTKGRMGRSIKMQRTGGF